MWKELQLYFIAYSYYDIWQHCALLVMFCPSQCVCKYIDERWMSRATAIQLIRIIEYVYNTELKLYLCMHCFQHRLAFIYKFSRKHKL